MADYYREMSGPLLLSSGQKSPPKAGKFIRYSSRHRPTERLDDARRSRGHHLIVPNRGNREVKKGLLMSIWRF